MAVRIGIIGAGFMGMTHIEGATKFQDKRGKRTISGSKLRGGKVVAFATRNKQKLAGDWTMVQGNFGPPGGNYDVSPLKPYSDYHDLLADPDIDLVDICLPADQHEQVTMEAIKAGKHVLVEKPIAVELAAANRMVKAAEKAGVQLMVAQVLPFFPEFRYAADCIEKGKYGAIKAAHFKRVIAQPNWSSDMSDFRKLGGWGVDLHIHDNHYISLICGVPKQVYSRGILQDGLVNHLHTNYVYDDSELAVTCVSGGIAAKGLAFGHGFEIYLEKATLLYDAGTYGGEWVVNRPLTLITNSGKVSEPKLKGGDDWCAAFTSELQVAVDGIRSGQTPRILSGTLARDALKLCYAEGKSIAAGRATKVN